MTPAAIEIRGLRKRYGKGAPAVDGLDLRVAAGKVVAFVGPNGAGKTTTLLSLLGMLQPDAGTLTIFGEEPGDRATRTRIGFQPEVFHTYPYLTAEGVLRFYGRLSGMDDASLATRVPEVLARFGLEQAARKKVGTFSKGMNQRLGLAQAVVHAPRLLILDEPTTGLDPSGRRLVAEVIDQEKGRGTTVFLSSHILSDVEQSCDEVIMIKHGKVVLAGDVAALVASRDRWSLEVDACGAELEGRLVAMGAELQRSQAGAGAGGAHVFCTSSAKNDVLRLLASASVSVGEVRRDRQTLEQLYLEQMEGIR